MNINMLRDVDDDFGFYSAVCGDGTAWHGASLFKSVDDGASYSNILAMPVQSDIGYASGALGNFLGPNIPDESNVLTVVMRNGTLSSVSYDDFLNGLNVAVIGSEIIYFRTATLIGTNTYTVSGLLRGRRGSEYAMDMHVAGERFVLLNPSSIYRVPGRSEDVGVSRLYKAVTVDATLAETPSQSFINVAAGLKPYSPVQLGGGINGSGDVILIWNRRTRVGGGWQNIADVPLSEASEIYEVEIWDSSFTTLYRTIFGISEETVTYPAADQVTDMGAVQSVIHFRVYQISSAISRGYGAQGSAPASTTIALPCSNTIAPLSSTQQDIATLKPAPTTILTTPSGIVNGQVITLEPGGVYIGTLDIASLSNVTIRASAGLPKPILTNGSAVTGWTLHSGSIYKAAIGFVPTHVSIDAVNCDLAHYPTRSTRWVTSNSGSDTSHVSYTLPGGAVGHMVGASIVIRTANATIEEHTVSAYSAGVITLDSPAALTALRQFYVEGKLWMLTENNSWVYDAGYLYVWSSDGLVLDGHEVWASIDDDGIDATLSVDCSISGVEIFGVGVAVQGVSSTNLSVRDSNILQSTVDGISAENCTGIAIENNTIADSYHDGVNCSGINTNPKIKNNRVTNAGMVGMPKYGIGILVGEASTDEVVSGNTVTNTSHHGISAVRAYDSLVSKNAVSDCCMALTNGSGIHTQSTGHSVTQNLSIEDNTVWCVVGDNGYADEGDSRQGSGIGLKDHAYGVSVTGNTVLDCAKNISMVSAVNSTITGNKLRIDDSNCRNILAMTESGSGASSGNTITGNDITVTSSSVVCYDIEATNLPSEATFDSNTYHINNPSAFAHTWDMVGSPSDLSYSGWKAATGQDAASTILGA